MTPTQLQILKNDMVGNASLTGFKNNMDDQSIANFYNIPNSGLTKVASYINRYDLLMWAATGPYSNIYQATLSGNAPYQSAALGMIKLFDVTGTLDIADKNLNNIVNTLRTNNILSAANVTALKALVNTSPATSGEALLGAGTIIGVNDVSMALRSYQ